MCLCILEFFHITQSYECMAKGHQMLCKNYIHHPI